jgi:hypothetical protein
MVAGAMVTAKRAPATAVTDTQVLENISVALKIYSQGALANSTPTAGYKALDTKITSLTTADLIKQLAPLTGNFFTYSPGDKLVTDTTYGYLTFVPGTSVTNANALITNTVALAENATLNPVDGTGGTIINGTNYTDPLPFDTSSGAGATLAVISTNAYIISNNVVYAISINGAGAFTATNYYGKITNSQIYSNYAAGPTAVQVATVNVEGTFAGGLYTNTNSAPNAFNNLGIWTMIVPTVTLLNGGTGSASISNFVTITQYSPSNAITAAHPNGLLTNATAPSVCVYTPAHAGSPVGLVAVSNWVTFGAPYSLMFYKESGNHLSGTNFSGANITSQTIYDLATLSIYTVYPGVNPTGQTNISINVEGFATGSVILKNLEMGGTPTNAEVFQVLAHETVDGVAGSGYIGGDLAPFGPIGPTGGGPPPPPYVNSTYTNVFNGVTNILDTIPFTDVAGDNGDYIGTNLFTTNANGTHLMLQFITNVLVQGTINLDYFTALGSANAIVPAAQ